MAAQIIPLPKRPKKRGRPRAIKAPCQVLKFTGFKRYTRDELVARHDINMAKKLREASQDALFGKLTGFVLITSNGTLEEGGGGYMAYLGGAMAEAPVSRVVEIVDWCAEALDERLESTRGF